MKCTVQIKEDKISAGKEPHHTRSVRMTENHRKHNKKCKKKKNFKK